jgi:hypothetical protein
MSNKNRQKFLFDYWFAIISFLKILNAWMEVKKALFLLVYYLYLILNS